MTGGGADQFGKSSIYANASDLLPRAKIFVAFFARLAFPACPVDPGQADAISSFDSGGASADINDPAYDLVAENQRLLDDGSELRPVAVGDVQVRVANAARFYPDQDLSVARFWVWRPLNGKRLLEFVEYRCLHGSKDDPFLRWKLSIVVDGYGYSAYPKRTNVHSVNKRSVF